MFRPAAVLFVRKNLLSWLDLKVYCSNEKRENSLFKKTCRPKRTKLEECDKKALGEICDKDIHECPKPEPPCCPGMVAAEQAEDNQETPENKSKKGAVEASKTSDETDVSVPADQESVELVVAEGQDDESFEPKIVIVGAGLAGLTAANRLFTTGVTNVTILEATERVGGRIKSAWFGDTVVNTGGTFEFDDESGIPEECAFENPITYHAEQLGLIKFRNNIPLASTLVTEFDGSALPLPASFLAVTKMKRILEVADSLKTTSSYNDQGRLDSYIGFRMKQELRLMPDELKIPASRVMAALAILYTGKTYVVTDSTGSYIEIPESNFRVPVGSTGVLAPLLQNLSGSIKLSQDVNNISWGSLNSLNGKRAVVRTSDGSEYNADFVIFTPSLGVLRKRHETMFCPPLPSSKVKAIQDTKFESVTKIHLYFKNPVHSWRQEKIHWTLDEEDTKSLKGPLVSLREIKEIQSSDKMLIVRLVGKGAAKAEIMPEKILIREIIKYIRKKSGDRVPYPDDVLITKWTGDKYFAGAVPLRGHSKLSEPLPSCGSPNPPVLFFAGDSTVDANIGGIRGAFVSGMREANRILSFLPGEKDDIMATDACLQLQSSLST